MKKISLILITSCLFLGCYYDKADVINPNAAYQPCDTTAVSYSKTIAPILTEYCNSCHAGSVSAGSGNSITLDTYTGVSTYGLNGQLVPAVMQNGGCPASAATCNAMPLSGPKLSDCNINKISAWVNQGAKNN